MPLTVFHWHTVLIENVCRLLCKSMLPTMFIKMCVKLKQIHLAWNVELEKLTSKLNATLKVKSPWNYVNFLLESPLNSLDIDLGKMCEPCNSFLTKFSGKVRELESQKARKSLETLLKKLVGNPEGVSHSFAEFTVWKACFPRVNWQI